MSITPICLMILPENGTWQSATESSKTLLEAEPSTSTANERSINESPDAVALGESVGSNIWGKFPERLMKACQNEQRAYEVDRRAMVATIADHMIHHLKDYSRSTAERMAKMITEKYPKTFSDVISDKVVGSGIETLRQQIYNAVNYRKFDKEAKKRVEFGLDDKDDDDVSEPVQPPRKQDEYGCVEYQPLLPSTETAQSQTDKKNALIKFFEAKEKDDEKITNLMNDTYPTQRMTINKKKRTLTQVFQDWPYLKTPQYIEKHASRLLGKPICKTWEEYLPKIAKSLRKFTIYTEKSQLLKAKKSTSHKEENEKSSEVLNLIAEARASSAATKSDISMMALAFPLIAIQLKEDLQLLCKVVSEDVLITELVNEVDADFPILIIRGKSLFDDEAKCDVIVEGNNISARDVLDGMLVTFLAFYVFGYEYRPGITKTLEFIQRALLQINPQTGHKQKGKQKKKTMSFDANVMKLASSLQAFEDD
ncbi:uncharacterized protein [Venturia canescens]|nr:uncharacterized protein LOC122416416 isoform X2 [Venturia canescens]XP_043285295.1 uncharacterized protein LOC122416416 isoform X2 [Venturia canescens]